MATPSGWTKGQHRETHGTGGGTKTETTSWEHGDSGIRVNINQLGNYDQPNAEIELIDMRREEFPGVLRYHVVEDTKTDAFTTARKAVVQFLRDNPDVPDTALDRGKDYKEQMDVSALEKVSE